MPTTYAQKQAPAQKKEAKTATSVVDCSSQGESLQRKADLANGAVQRVVQRETGIVQREGEADGKFKYEAYKSGNGVINEPGKICFSEYQNEETKSIGFSGCLMMAFKFKDKEKSTVLLSDKTTIDIEKHYIAHAYCSSDAKRDTKEALLDAESRDLIVIEALFKPRTPADSIKIQEKQAEDDQNFFTGGLTFTQDSSTQQGSWSADVYAESEGTYDKIKGAYPESDDVSWRLKHFDKNALNIQTDATKAFIYASLGNQEKMNTILNKHQDEKFFDLFLDLFLLENLQNMLNEHFFSDEKNQKVQEKINLLQIKEDVTDAFIKASGKKYEQMHGILNKHQDDEFFARFLNRCSLIVLQNMINDQVFDYDRNQAVLKKINELGGSSSSSSDVSEEDLSTGCCNIM